MATKRQPDAPDSAAVQSAPVERAEAAGQTTEGQSTGQETGTKFGEDEYTREQLVSHARVMFDQPGFLVEVALRKGFPEDQQFIGLDDAKSVVEDYSNRQVEV
jgi:hypothetical protein